MDWSQSPQACPGWRGRLVCIPRSSLRFFLFIILIILSRNQYHCASHRCKAMRSIAISSCASKGEIRVDFVVQYLLCCVGENMDFHCIWIILCYLIKVEKGFNRCSLGQLVNTEDLLFDEDIFFSCSFFFAWIICSNVGSTRIWDADFSSQKVNWSAM